MIGYLEYPPDFYSPATYQNIGFSFPHGFALTESFDYLENHFFDRNYIVPWYIIQINPQFTGSISDIINMLNNNEDFVALSVMYIRLKGLSEMIAEESNIFTKAVEYAKTHVHKKFDYSVIIEYNDNMYLTVEYIINVVQNIIIHVIRYVLFNNKFPEWFNDDIIDKIIIVAKEWKQLPLYMHSDVSGAIYFTLLIPLIEKLYILANNFNNHITVEKW